MVSYIVVNIGLGNDLSSIQCQAITSTNDDIVNWNIRNKIK